jgi:hypothetical protein
MLSRKRAWTTYIDIWWKETFKLEKISDDLRVIDKGFEERQSVMVPFSFIQRRDQKIFCNSILFPPQQALGSQLPEVLFSNYSRFGSAKFSQIGP